MKKNLYKALSLPTMLALMAVCAPKNNAVAGMIDPYIGIGGFNQSSSFSDAVTLDSDFTGWLFSAGLKFKIPVFVSARTEIEYSKIDTKDFVNKELFEYEAYSANAYLDLPIFPVIKPYVGVGIGRMSDATLISDNRVFNGNTNTFQYMFGFDIKIPMVPIGTTIEYRRTQPDDEVYGQKFEMNSILLKARWEF